MVPFGRVLKLKQILSQSLSLTITIFARRVITPYTVLSFWNVSHIICQKVRDTTFLGSPKVFRRTVAINLHSNTRDAETYSSSVFRALT